MTTPDPLHRDGNRDAVARAVHAYGGPDRWRGPGHLEATVDAAGLLFPLRRRKPQRDLTLKIDQQEQYVLFQDYPQPGQQGLFDAGTVEIRRGRETIARREHARRAFRWSLRRQLRWDDLDLLYFGAYAWWTYLLGPAAWLRTDVVATALDDHTVDVTYSPELHTHSLRQRFHLDNRARVVRHDYTARVVSPFAMAAHFAADHQELDGLPIATRRWVRPRLPGGLVLPGPTLVALRVHRLAHHCGQALRSTL